MANGVVLLRERSGPGRGSTINLEQNMCWTLLGHPRGSHINDPEAKLSSARLGTYSPSISQKLGAEHEIRIRTRITPIVGIARCSACVPQSCIFLAVLIFLMNCSVNAGVLACQGTFVDMICSYRQLINDCPLPGDEPRAQMIVIAKAWWGAKEYITGPSFTFRLSGQYPALPTNEGSGRK
ncbi:unnamed protein product [Nesidiocoris tenuis]|uniref:Uncharacterized protein n=1 Tax=Nesidiocoris tenuis TaxID=355587 RepID=A0A6H5GH84_9HEMI|nr:unnamed protein product [Nesidiocoris tenuis]